MIKTGSLSVAALAAAIGCASHTPGHPAPLSARHEPIPLTVKPDTLRTFDGRSYPIEIGQLQVPSDRSRRSSPPLTLRFIRLRSTSPTPGPPIVFLMGGPGIPATVMAGVPPYNDLFQSLRAFGDVILPDQRGIGRSSPTLECKSPGNMPGNAFANRQALVEILSERTAQCAREWREKGIEPASFSTAASADDLDDLRRALGSKRMNLLAFSYGTRLALATLQRHPRSIDRAVLASVNGPDNALKLPATLDQKLRTIFRLAEADTAFGAAPGELLEAFQRIRTRLRADPLRFAVAGGSGSPGPIVVGEDGFNALVALNIDNPRLPAMVLAQGRGDSTILQHMAQAAFQGLGASATSLMARAVNCSAERSHARLSVVRAQAPSSLIGDPIDNWFLTDEYCALIGSFGRESAREFRGPVRSDARILFLSGTLDSNTPPSNVDDIDDGFPNGIHLIVKNGQHETLPLRPVQELIVDFFAGRDVSGKRIETAPPRFMGVEAAKTQPALRR